MEGNSGSDTGSLFLQMVLTLQTSAMQHLGKIASPFTGKVERDLMSAKAAVDMLVMLREKTKGNLNDAENKVLDHVIYELQMNYVDEANKPDPQEEPGPDAPQEETAESEESTEKDEGQS
jgi:hypothetical protein